MKILAVADTEDKFIWDYFDKEKFKDVELIISCGDLKANYLEFLVTMIPAPLLYVHGNHDEIYYKEPPEGCIDIDGKVYIHDNGIRILGLGGSMRYRPDRQDQYTESEMEKRIGKLRRIIKKTGGIDIFVAHSPAYKIGDGEDTAHTGFKCFINLVLNCYRPKYFLHGHQHASYNRRMKRKHKYLNTEIINVGPYYLFDYKVQPQAEEE